MGDLSFRQTPIWQLIWVPAAISLGVTLLRLVGELAHWSKTFFNPAPGGPGSIVGIVWLAPLFGIYFALKLVAKSEGPRSFGKAIGLAVLGVVIIFVFSAAGSALKIDRAFHGRLLYFWAVLALAALTTFPGWPALFKTLTAYAYAARIPVAILMFFAFRGNWGTHYDAVPPDLPAGTGLWAKYLWLGFFPQLILWVAFTILAGMLFGSIVAGLARLVRHSPQHTT
jgi:hypothetical protein